MPPELGSKSTVLALRLPPGSTSLAVTATVTLTVSGVAMLGGVRATSSEATGLELDVVTVNVDTLEVAPVWSCTV